MYNLSAVYTEARQICGMMMVYVRQLATEACNYVGDTSSRDRLCACAVAFPVGLYLCLFYVFMFIYVYLQTEFCSCSAHK